MSATKESDGITEEEIVRDLVDDPDNAHVLQSFDLAMKRLGKAIGYPYSWQGTRREQAQFVAEHFIFPSLERSPA
jgi:hypothetical protein